MKTLLLLAMLAGQDLATRKVALDEHQRTLANADEAAALARMYVALADDAAKEDQYELAIKSIQAAAVIAAKAGEADLALSAKARGTELAKLKVEFAKVQEAQKKLLTEEDPVARLVVGRYLCFTKGNWLEGIPHLAQCSDAAIKSAAEKDFRAKTAEEFGWTADEWLIVAGKYPGYRMATADRAAQLHRILWTQASGLEKEKLRTKLRAIAGFSPQPSVGGAFPSWTNIDALNRVFVEQNFAHSGRRSLRFDRDRDSEKGLALVDYEEPFPAKPLKEYTLSLWVWSNRNTGERSYISVAWIDANGKFITFTEVPLTVDAPIWTRLTKSWTCPENAAKIDMQIGVSYNGRCTVFVDDISLTVDGKEMVRNGSFEVTDRK